MLWKMCEMRKVLETHPSPISLQLKLHVVRVRKEVFESISSRDVDMSALSRLWVIMKTHYVSSCSVWVRAISECSDG